MTTSRPDPSPASTSRAMLRALLPAAFLALAASTRHGDAADGFFVDATEASGITFRHTFGDDTMSNIVEATGSGVAFLDHDVDGNLDVYFVNGCPLEGVSDPAALTAKGPRPTNRLFRGKGDGTFEDVTAKAGAGDPGYGMGVVVGDYDNDGYPDIYVTNYGRNVLYRNEGDGTFADVTAKARVGCELWSVGAVFLDHDSDGDLDLFVGNYLQFDPTYESPDDRLFAGPLSYPGQKDALYRNEGDGTFTDVASAAGVAAEGRAMGAIAADYDDDGRVDLYVANDAMANFLYRNVGGGRFVDVGLESGTAYSADGDSSASMGGEFADYDGDGRLDLFVPDIKNNNLYRNLGDGLFEDVTNVTGIARASRQYTSWGGCFLDFDNDGDRDIFVSNGSEFGIGNEENLLLENLPGGRGGRTFANAREKAGPAIAVRNIARGAAMGDYDNDGDMDVAVLCLDGPSRLLRNEAGGRNAWLHVRLVGTRSNRDGVGARVTVRAGGLLLVDERKSAASYLSQNDPRLFFGLGSRTRVDEIIVRWPSGTVQRIDGAAAKGTIEIREAGGEKG